MIEFHPDEEWLEIPDWEEYLVSTHGRCYSTKTRRMLTLSYVDRQRGNSHRGDWVWHVRKPGNVRSMIHAARMVLGLFVVTRGRGWTPRYLDGDRSNVALSNLEWIQQNYQTYTAEQLSAVMRERANVGAEIRRRKADPPAKPRVHPQLPTPSDSESGVRRPHDAVSPAPHAPLPDFRSPTFLPPSRRERDS